MYLIEFAPFLHGWTYTPGTTKNLFRIDFGRSFFFRVTTTHIFFSKIEQKLNLSFYTFTLLLHQMLLFFRGSTVTFVKWCLLFFAYFFPVQSVRPEALLSCHISSWVPATSPGCHSQHKASCFEFSNISINRRISVRLDFYLPAELHLSALLRSIVGVTYGR